MNKKKKIIKVKKKDCAYICLKCVCIFSVCIVIVNNHDLLFDIMYFNCI